MSVQGLEFDKPTLVDGGHEQKAIVNTASGKQPVNAPTVEDIKRIAKGEAETEGDKSYTKTESDAKFLSKTDAASTYYTKTESDARYSGKESGGYKMQVAILPASFKQSTESPRDATEEELNWLQENYNSLFIQSSLLMRLTNNNNDADFLSFNASAQDFYEDSVSYTEAIQVTYNKTTEKIEVVYAYVD